MKYWTRILKSTAQSLTDKKIDSEEAAIGVLLENDIRVHNFKQKIPLAQVEKVIGILSELYPKNLLDVGSGRGTFLYPLITKIPSLQVTSIEKSEYWSRLHSGLIKDFNFRSINGDVTDLSIFGDNHFECVTALEVLEHIEDYEDYEKAIKEICRVSKNWVIISVPDNLFNKNSLTKLFEDAGAVSIKFDLVMNHFVAIIKFMGYTREEIRLPNGEYDAIQNGFHLEIIVPEGENVITTTSVGVKGLNIKRKLRITNQIVECIE